MGAPKAGPSGLADRSAQRRMSQLLVSYRSPFLETIPSELTETIPPPIVLSRPSEPGDASTDTLAVASADADTAANDGTSTPGYHAAA